ncbi:MAG: hypothetical protein A7316_08035 [Candidatus Altiarchaeales archaeon WOR_SM1_86-2]|nr:MAG: hypothetical protein A7316_08035 [Candidatus Altiarchaeales archaeon WOR_SM1_86-2]
MTTLTLKFEGAHEEIINAMLKSKIAKTKSEAVRMALLTFGLSTGIIKNRFVLRGIRKDLSKDAFNAKEIESEIERIKNESIRR